jgi:hypothetical protein
MLRVLVPKVIIRVNRVVNNNNKKNKMRINKEVKAKNILGIKVKTSIEAKV